MAGYSKTPLWKKLGYKPGYTVRPINAPAGYQALVAPLPDGVRFNRGEEPFDLIHAFYHCQSELAERLPELKGSITVDGAIWISWPKKSAGVAGDLDGNGIRAVALPLGLVDIKVCAVDDTWSALKLVIRRENRPQLKNR